MKKILVISLIAVIIALSAWVLWANTALQLHVVTLEERSLPEAFDGYRIAHVSDFHSAALADQTIELLQSAAPDIICITGDLADSRDKSMDAAVNFAAQAAQIAPCYYITGNHEAQLSEKLYAELLERLADCGVTVLADREVRLAKSDAEIALAGHFWGDTHEIEQLSAFPGYRILLSHQPEDFANYAAAGYELVLTGHAHGGQFRLPFVGGIYAPGQGFFPKYDAGVYSQGCTDMVVSRGIGNSTIPLRINNRPEVVVVVLESLTEVV